MNFLKLLRTNWPFVLPYGALLFGLGVYQILYRQGIILLEINRYYSFQADVFFKYFTHLGDGAFCISVGILLMFWSRAKGILILISYAVSGILAQLIKNFGFPREPRPAEYFSRMMNLLHTVSGVELSHWNSFPSGHTTSAFAFFALIAVWVKHPMLKFLCLLCAVTVAFSRMYLLQHFLVDVYVGSLLGTITAWVLLINYMPAIEKIKMPLLK
ncbi:phosphatase PAP2 family protein [Runella sp.]|jgi:membrane-associated phospholipid phosphatase|uniref:phosphatase PAP2 family protein n=1 Tax=Runella sp. TaxID=1960881 RepID=UPI0026145708|nr:phosphatase PAP2 family protein [Runella sp.]